MFGADKFDNQKKQEPQIRAISGEKNQVLIDIVHSIMEMYLVALHTTYRRCAEAYVVTYDADIGDLQKSDVSHPVNLLLSIGTATVAQACAKMLCEVIAFNLQEGILTQSKADELIDLVGDRFKIEIVEYMPQAIKDVHEAFNKN